jgi:gliding motility-associated-like protein
MKKSPVFFLLWIAFAGLSLQAQEKSYSTSASDCKIAAPNAFTPNDDGVNDRFKLVIVGSCEFLRFELRIFDRWGRLVFESTDPEMEWDGGYDGQRLKEGVYLWQSSVVYGGNRSETKKGSVVLIR